MHNSIHVKNQCRIDGQLKAAYRGMVLTLNHPEMYNKLELSQNVNSFEK